MGKRRDLRQPKVPVQPEPGPVLGLFRSLYGVNVFEFAARQRPLIAAASRRSASRKQP